MIPALVLAFLSGSFPAAYLAGRAKNIDIRQHGSGNVGATNAFRVLGKKIGTAVFAVDFLKGFVPVYLLPRVFGLPDSSALWIGVAAILGHVFTPWLAFKGGKGIATGAGVLLALNTTLFLIGIGTWVLAFMLTRIVSLSSLLAVLALFGGCFIVPGLSSEHRMFFAGAVLFVLWTHRSNIQRLLKGEEKSVG